MYIITFTNVNGGINSHLVEAKDLAQAYEVAKVLSGGTPVNVVIV